MHQNNEIFAEKPGSVTSNDIRPGNGGPIRLTSQDIGREEHLRCDLFCVEWDV